jgi:hypothetical protein
MDVFAVGAAIGKIKLLTDKNLIKTTLIAALSIIIMLVFVIFLVITIFINLFFSLDTKRMNSTNIEFMEGLGILSEIYESNGDPGTIVNNEGDIGGKSYGPWQIASGVGTMDSFLRWLKDYDADLYDRLNKAKAKDNNKYGSSFDEEWKKIADEDRDYFYQVQWCFIKATHYDPVVKYFRKKGIIDFDKRSWTLRNVVWSTAVQHGAGDANSGAILIIGKQDLNLSENLEDDAKVITGVYSERKKVNIYFASASQEIKISVFNRFIQEEADALEMLRQELNKLKGEANG